MMFGKFSADPAAPAVAAAAGGRFSLIELRRLHQELVENKEVNDSNESVVVEILRVLAEMVVYGDNKSELLFDFFCEKNMLSLFLEIMWTEGGCPSAVHIQVLQTLSILISCVRNDTSLYYLLSNNRINEIIIYPHDFQSDESLCAQFASFMKTLSLRLNEQTVQFFFIEETGAFPILSRAVELLHISDPMIRVASQTTILNVYRVEDDRARAYALQDEVMQGLFEQVIRIMTAQFNSISETCTIYAKASTELDEAGTTKLEYLLEDQLASAEDWFYYLQDLLDLPIPPLRRALIAFLDSEFIQAVLLAPLTSHFESEITSSVGNQMPEEGSSPAVSVSTAYASAKSDLDQLTNTLKVSSALAYVLQMLRIISHPLLHRTCMVTLFHPLSAHQRSLVASEIINTAISELSHGAEETLNGRHHTDSAVQSTLINTVRAAEHEGTSSTESTSQTTETSAFCRGYQDTLASISSVSVTMEAALVANPIKSAWDALLVHHNQKITLIMALILHIFMDKLSTELLSFEAPDGSNSLKVAVDDKLLQEDDVLNASAQVGYEPQDQVMGEVCLNKYDRTAIQCMQVLMSMHFLPELEHVLSSEEKEIREAIKAVEGMQLKAERIHSKSEVSINGQNSNEAVENKASDAATGNEAVFNVMGITHQSVLQRRSELTFEASTYQFVDAPADANNSVGRQVTSRRAIALTADVQQIGHQDLRSIPVLLRMRQLIMPFDYKENCHYDSSQKDRNSPFLSSPSTVEMMVAVLQQARNYSLLTVQTIAHALFSLCTVLSKAANEKLDLGETAEFRPLSVIFGHINIDNLEVAASALQFADDHQQKEEQEQQQGNEKAPNYVPSRILQFLIEQVRNAVRYAAMVLLDRTDGPFSEVILMFIKEELRRFEDRKWKACFKQMYKDPLLFLPITAANFDRFGIDFDLPISQTEVLRKDIQTFLLLKELYCRMQRMQQQPQNPENYSVELCQGINDRSFLNLEEDNIIPGGVCIDAPYNMKGKRFLDTRIAPDYVQAVYGINASISSDGGGHGLSDSSQQSTGLLSALGSFGLMQPQEQSSSTNATVAASVDGGDAAPLYMPLTTRQKLLFVQDQKLLMIAYSCKIEARNAFRLFLVAPLLYADAQVDPLDGRKFTILIRSTQHVPRTLQLQGDISLLMAEMNGSEELSSPNAGETNRKRFLSPRRFLPGNGFGLRNGGKVSNNGRASGANASTGNSATSSTQRQRSVASGASGGKRSAERFLKAADPSTFWQLGLCMDTVQACRLAAQHIESKRKELNEEKLKLLKQVLQAWVLESNS